MSSGNNGFNRTVTTSAKRQDSAREIRVIGSDGEMLGVMPRRGTQDC